MTTTLALSATDSLGGLAFLADAAAKGLMVLAAAAAVTWALRRGSAALRHVIWTLAVAALFAVPVFSAALPAWRVPLLPSWAEPDARELTGPAAVKLEILSQPAAEPREFGGSRPVAAADPAPALPAEPVVPAAAPLHWSAWVLLIWAAVSAAMAILLVVGTAAAWNMRRRASPITEAGWLALVAELGRSLGVRRRVTLLRSRGSPIPLTCGILRPVIVLPAEADGWSTERRTMVLLHELAHIKRGDCLTQAVARLARVVYWFNPLVWLAGRMLRVERERACDDMVLAAGHKASAYAANLLEIVSTLRSARCPSLAAVAMAKRSQFEGRMLAILDPRRNRRSLTRWGLVIAALLVAGVAVPLASMKATTVEKPADTSTSVAAPNEASPTGTSAATPVAPAGKSSWRVTLPCGVPVELVGVTANPVTDGAWWRPDGTPMAGTPEYYPGDAKALTLDHAGNSFFIRMDNVLMIGRQPGDFEVFHRIEPGPADGRGLSWSQSNEIIRPAAGGPGNAGKAEVRVTRIYVLSQVFPEGTDRATIRFGVAAGPWETLAMRITNGSAGGQVTVKGEAGKNRDVSFGAPYEAADPGLGGITTTFVTVSHNVAADRQVRVVAIMTDGKEAIGGGLGVSDGHIQQMTQSFRRGWGAGPGDMLAVKDIKEFQLQTRAFQWAEFKDVALRPAGAAAPAPQPPSVAPEKSAGNDAPPAAPRESDRPVGPSYTLEGVVRPGIYAMGPLPQTAFDALAVGLPPADMKEDWCVQIIRREGADRPEKTVAVMTLKDLLKTGAAEMVLHPDDTVRVVRPEAGEAAAPKAEPAAFSGPTKEDLRPIDEPYILEPTDELQITVTSGPEANRQSNVETVYVDADGMVAAAGCRVKAAGLTVDQLTKDLTVAATAPGAAGPSLKAEITQRANWTFTLLGLPPAKLRAGVYLTPKRDISLLEVLPLGNVTARSGNLYVVRRRFDGDRAVQTRVIQVDAAKLVAGDPSLNLMIHPRDIVYVAQADAASSPPLGMVLSVGSDGTVTGIGIDTRGYDTPTPGTLPAAPGPKGKAEATVTATGTLVLADDVLRPGDIVDITVMELLEPGKPYVTRLRLSQTGEVPFPYIGVVKYAGLTPRGLEQKIADLLSPGELANPQVSVSVVGAPAITATASGAGKPPADLYIMGDVGRPGVYSIADRKMTLLQLLAAAGFKPENKGDTATIIRKATGGREERLVFDIDAVLAGKAADPDLQAGDLVQVRPRLNAEQQQRLNELKAAEKSQAEEVDSLITRLGANHPTVVATRDRLATIRAQIAELERPAATPAATPSAAPGRSAGD